MAIPHDLTPAARAVEGLLPGISEKQLSDRTPCPEYTVKGMLFHLLGLSTAFRAAAEKDLGPLTATAPEPTTPELPSDWRAQLPARLDELVSAWQDPQAWDGQTQVGGVDLPGAAAGQFALNELVIHGWDLARATGQHFDPGEACAGVSYDLLSSFADPGSRPPIFGPVVPVPAGASSLDRAVGMSGRNPSWDRSQVDG
jgi:uncharacterized protein (TIGR03086 family)